MNYDRIYEYRFQNVDLEKKKVIWKEIAQFVQEKLKKPRAILDPAAGQCEFINAVPAEERWGIDMNEQIRHYADKNVKTIVGNNLTTELPDNYFDAVFVSNFLEHLDTQQEVAIFLSRMFKTLKKGGRIAVMGPNFKHTYREYFDFADHTVILTELGLAEHLYGAGFYITEIKSRFLPLSFRGRLPVNRVLARIYLHATPLWRIFGKQFLLIAEKR